MVSWFRHKLLALVHFIFGRARRTDALNRIAESQVFIMGQLEEINTKLNDATNRVADLLAKDAADLAAAKAAGQAPAQSTLDSLAASVARLQSFGADPANPIPVAPPSVVADPAPATSPAPPAPDASSSPTDPTKTT